MKTLILILALPLSALGQTITTNWVTAPATLRVVDGRLFNIEKSTNWLRLEAQCLETFTNGIKVQTFPTPSRVIGNGRELRSGNIYGVTILEEEKPGTFIPYDSSFFIKNYPTNLPASYGQRISGKVMKTDIVTLPTGERIQAWDWGKPHTVAILKTNATPKGEATLSAK